MIWGPLALAFIFICMCISVMQMHGCVYICVWRCIAYVLEECVHMCVYIGVWICIHVEGACAYFCRSACAEVWGSTLRVCLLSELSSHWELQ